MKTHYASLEMANESTMYNEWGSSYCGLEYTESPFTNKEKEVTCKKCLKAIEKEKKRIVKSSI